MKAANSVQQANAPASPVDLKEVIKKSVLKLGAKQTKEQKIEIAKALIKIFEKKMTPQQALNISDQDIAIMYSYAYKVFNAGKFEEARELFKMLLTLKPGDVGFATSLGACYHKLKDYENAAVAYMLAIQLDPMDPVPFFYCYNCFVELNDLPGAAMMLQNAIISAGQDPAKYSKIKERASLMLKNTEKQINEQKRNAEETKK